MVEVVTRAVNLEGSNYEVGYKLGSLLKTSAERDRILNSKGRLDEKRLSRSKKIIEEYTPKIVKELEGFSEGIGVDKDLVLNYVMSSLRPSCSQVGLSKNRTEDGHIILFRNFESSQQLEDFILVRTKVEGKYSHIGTSELFFGRDDGINDQGLAISMGSCGESDSSNKRRVKNKGERKGFQCWVAIREVLENCSNVDEGISYLKNFPISSNVNFVLADRNNKLGLFNVIDGDIDIEIRDDKSKDGSIYITNHFDDYKMEKYGQISVNNSIERYEIIDEFITSRDKISIGEIKTFLTEKYPKGLYFNNYENNFGTTKSIIMDCSEGSLEILWGGRKENRWNKYKLEDRLEDREEKILLDYERLKEL